MRGRRGRRDFRILSLAGGGYLGLFTAALLADWERRCGEPLARRFDLVAGTSVGGLLAIGLGYEVPMQSMLDLFLARGSTIFSPRGLPTSTVGRLIDLSRSVTSPKYDGAALREALQQMLGPRTLRESVHALVVPAVDVRHSRTKVFKTPHAAASSGDEDARAVDVAMATSAAPGYFPAVAVGGTLYADGGLYAVAPDQVALHEAEHFMRVAPSAIRMLSVGTATRGYRPLEAIDADDGAVAWLSEGRLILTLIAVQQQHVQAMMEDRLDQRYLRVDADWPRGAGLGIDVATREAAATLERLAAQAARSADHERLARLFDIPRA